MRKVPMEMKVFEKQQLEMAGFGQTQANIIWKLIRLACKINIKICFSFYYSYC